jgi:uncharacterized protein
MIETRYVWDEAKNRTNQKKHGISFKQAAQVFQDPFHVLIQDRFESGEERWQTFGVVDGVLLLMVAHTIDDGNEFEEVIRIISARKATKPERRQYENKNG